MTPEGNFVSPHKVGTGTTGGVGGAPGTGTTGGRAPGLQGPQGGGWGTRYRDHRGQGTRVTGTTGGGAPGTGTTGGGAPGLQEPQGVGHQGYRNHRGVGHQGYKNHGGGGTRRYIGTYFCLCPQDVSRQHAAMLAPLSGGRVTITAFQIGYLRSAITIAIRWVGHIPRGAHGQQWLLYCSGTRHVVASLAPLPRKSCQYWSTSCSNGGCSLMLLLPLCGATLPHLCTWITPMH